MKQGSNRRLANVKTREETGLTFVMSKLDLMTPFAQKLLKETRPYFPGQEEELRQELNRVECMMRFAEQEPKKVAELQEVFMCMKDLSNSIRRGAADALTTVELFEIKSMLLEMDHIRRLWMCWIPGRTG